MLRGKEKQFRLAFRIGLGNNLIFLSTYGAACALGGFQCSSFTAQTFLAQYAFWFFIPQAAIACIAFMAFLLILGFGYPDDYEKRDYYRSAIYFASLISIGLVF